MLQPLLQASTSMRERDVASQVVFPGDTMKVLFIVPRFHTNLFHAVKALRLAGAEVHLYCREQDALEDHSFVKPTLIDTRNTTWSQTRRILTAIDPDLVVIRKVERFSTVAFWMCVAQRR